MKAIWMMALKDLRLLVRDRTAFFFTFFFPLIYATFFGMIFSGAANDEGQALAVLLVDQDQTVQSAAFAERLGAGPELDLQKAESLEEAREAVRRGRRTAFLVLPQGFGEASKTRFAGTTPRVELGVDPARKAEEGMLRGILMGYAAEDLQAVFSDPQAMKEQMQAAQASVQDAPAEVRESLGSMFQQIDRLMATPAPGQGQPGFQGFVPIQVDSVPVTIQRSGPRNAYSISFPQGIIWGILGCASGFAISLVLERQRGTLTRMLMSPLNRMQILGGKAVACFLTILLVSGGLLLLARLVFGVTLTSPWLLLMALVSIATGFVGIMLFLSVLGRTEQAAGGIGWAIMLVMAMLGGGMIPLFLMPSWLQTASHISPVKWSILAMEGALWRQFTFVEMLTPCLVLVTIGACCFGLGVRAFSWVQEA